MTGSGRYGGGSVSLKDADRFTAGNEPATVWLLHRVSRHRWALPVAHRYRRRSAKSPPSSLILRGALLDLAVGRKDRRKLKISPGLDTALLQLHSVITSSVISRLVNFPRLTAADGSIAQNALVQLHK